MKIQPVFSSIIAVDFLNVDNNALEIYCKKQNQARENPNDLSQTCKLDIESLEMKTLVDKVSKSFNDLHYQLGFRKDSSQQIANASVNIDNNYVINSAHSHPGWFFSGVYYVKADNGSGNINFISPNSNTANSILPEMLESPNSFTSSSCAHAPQVGKLLIFPSWLIHFVSSSLENSERISIAFNTRLIMPKGSMEGFR